MVNNRKLSEIAAEIAAEIKNGNWKRQSAYAAIPYLNAMGELESIEQQYHSDSAKSVVLYFLANAGTWRGEIARRVKKELNDMVKAAKG